MHVEVAHGCGRTHHGHQSLAECTWPEAAYIVGDGAYAVLARCGMFTVALYETDAEARRRKLVLDRSGCAQVCEGHHEVATLVDDVSSGSVRPAAARSGRRRRTSSRAR